MEYSKIVSVTGLPGLFEMVSSKADGAIVRSLDDKNSRFLSSRIHQFSQLETIEVFTKKENVNLVEVFMAMEKAKEKLPEEKDASAVKKYFEKVYSDMNFERVYSSDMKKMVRWYAVLKAHNIEFKLSEVPEGEERLLGEEKNMEKKLNPSGGKAMEKPMRNAPPKKTIRNRKTGE